MEKIAVYSTMTLVRIAQAYSTHVVGICQSKDLLDKVPAYSGITIPLLLLLATVSAGIAALSAKEVYWTYFAGAEQSQRFNVSNGPSNHQMLYYKFKQKGGYFQSKECSRMTKFQVMLIYL